ncbi:3-hydroxybutyryl-CoA dehydrogenase [Paracoccus sp. S-4012]|uniref:3-hydroxybutyryl-CoA dehydrogenase n=1 Tax=Paracoccus sp. S-4012 TaxID=2665648 RepID=UPI0012B024F0|nr:3-hydroxybutyryl-CoA dehydrogenase [Paracoccus sp. S-4012]MRX50029.1 3-hydroxybutyryl-CoA dehydrogenase [Paracoccus sp. S-4012]
MSPARDSIVALGAGRMGRGIAIVFAYAGHPVVLLDFKDREDGAFGQLAGEAQAEIRETLGLMHGLGLFDDPALIDRIAARIRVLPKSEAAPALAGAGFVFEGFPEIPELKRAALAEASALCGPQTILASTTSTILVDDLSPAVADPSRFLNAHWLNPAFIVPLVELSPGRATAPETTARLTALLEGIGKVPVTCAARPGYIVPRLQTVAMNEAARLAEEGVASVEDIEKAVKYGFGFRFSVLGLLEFIDWGGGDILHHASNYLVEAMEDDRYAAPGVIGRNMAEGRIGLKTGAGFLDYADMDIPAYRKHRLGAFVERLRELDLGRPPVV